MKIVEHRRATWHSEVLIAGIFGHVLEFYDFTIYAVFAFAIGAAFFPEASETLQLVQSLAVFASGFLMRPIGGILFGHIGDRYGRRTALTASIVGMAFATFFIGLLPDHSKIGVLAPVLLVFLKLLQGLCIGGEVTGGSMFVQEHFRGKSQGLLSGMTNSATVLGILLATGVGMWLNASYPTHEGWRYAFYIGGIAGIIGLYFRMMIDETPAFKEMREANKIVKLPIKRVITGNFRGVFVAMMMGAVISTTGYIALVFTRLFLQKFAGHDANIALKFAIVSNVFAIILLPIIGKISDTVGYLRTMVIFSTISIFASIPTLILTSSSNYMEIYIATACMGALFAGIYAPIYPIMMRLFIPEERYSGMAFGFNMGIALFGGFTPMICTILAEYTGLLYSPAFYWNFVVMLFLISMFWNRRFLRKIMRSST